MVLLKPAVLIDALESQFAENGNAALLDQIGFLERQITGKQVEDDKLYRAYMAGAFDEYEFAEQRRFLKEAAQSLRAETERLRAKVLTRDAVEMQKQFILETAEQLKQTGDFQDVPFELKQQIIKLVVTKIVLHTTEGWFRLEGAISGLYFLTDTPPDGTSGGSGKKVLNKPNSPSTDESGNTPNAILPFVTKNARILESRSE